jgi:hypothetical protein
VVFRDLQDVHTIASLAVERISWGLKRLHDVMQMAAEPHRQIDSHRGDADMQGAWSEATHGPHPMCEETVMNATGMLLLEDPGLQSFVPEAFAPIAWDIGGVEPPMPFQPKREPDYSQNTGLLDSIGSDEEIDDVRSVGAMQGYRRSTTMRSAPTRFATPTMDDRQPPGVTASTSHTNITRATQQHEFQPTFSEGPHRLGHAPHSGNPLLRNESNNEWGYRSVPSAVDLRQSSYAGGFSALHQVPVAQMRHNSCPSLHQPAPAPPLSRPPYSSPGALNLQPSTRKSRPLPGSLGISDQASFRDFLETIPQSASPTTSPSVHSSWTTKTAGRPATFQMPDSAPNCSLPFHVGQVGLSQGLAHEQETAFSYPMHFSETTPMITPPGAEYMSVHEWKRWIGSSGTG